MADVKDLIGKTLTSVEQGDEQIVFTAEGDERVSPSGLHTQK